MIFQVQVNLFCLFLQLHGLRKIQKHFAKFERTGTLTEFDKIKNTKTNDVSNLLKFVSIFQKTLFLERCSIHSPLFRIIVNNH